jgi:hypothetical protein
MAINLNPNIAATFNKVNNDPKVKAGFVNLGNDNINTNTQLSKGLEKVIALIARFIINAQSSVIGFLYGKFQRQDSSNPITRALDRGILNVLNEIAGVDFCNLINYALSKTPGGEPFDPNNPPPTDSQLERSKWVLQKTAYDIQTYIDRYYRSYSDTLNPPSKQALYDLIQQVSQGIQNITGPSGLLNNGELRTSFPELSTASNFLQDTLGFFNQYTDLRQIPNEDLRKLIDKIDKIRFYCVAIQGLNSPSAVVNFADNLTGGRLQEEIAKINKIITPTKLIPLLKNILKVANNINSIALKVLQYISTGRVIIKILVLLIRVFDVIKAFFISNPAPALFVPVGPILKFSNTLEQRIEESGKKKSVKRLRQIDAVLGLVASFVSILIAGMFDIIQKLNVILLNLESCNNIDPELKQEIQNTIDNLSNSINQLQDFLDRYNQAESDRERSFGEYTIEIVTEQIVDEGINIRRRFGVARNNNNVIVVQSTPTFASLDLIIINEVKVLLVSGGFVNIGLSTLDAEETVAVTDAVRYLDTNDLSDVEITQQDVDVLNDANDGLGLQSFLNNLPGGKALRKRIRKQLIKQNQDLVKNLKSTDPNSTYSQSIIKQKEEETAKLKIEGLLEEKKKLKALLLVSNPLGYATILIRISDIDKEVNSLRKQFNIKPNP